MKIPGQISVENNNNATYFCARRQVLRLSQQNAQRQSRLPSGRWLRRHSNAQCRNQPPLWGNAKVPQNRRSCCGVVGKYGHRRRRQSQRLHSQPDSVKAPASGKRGFLLWAVEQRDRGGRSHYRCLGGQRAGQAHAVERLKSAWSQHQTGAGGNPTLDVSRWIDFYKSFQGYGQ